MTSLKDAQFNRVQDMLLEQEKLQAIFKENSHVKNIPVIVYVSVLAQHYLT